MVLSLGRTTAKATLNAQVTLRLRLSLRFVVELTGCT